MRTSKNNCKNCTGEEKAKKATLKELIPVYGETKEKADMFKKAAEKQNADIKKEMVKLLKDEDTKVEAEAGGWIATYSIRTYTSFNEEAMIEFLKEHKEDFAGCVKKKEYIDEKVLEDLLYHGKVSKKLVVALDKFREEKQTAYLTIKRKEE